MPLCIAGMHRSGSSMIARLLNLCGLHLGPEKDLLSPAPDNPEGFWENRDFLRLNDAILKALGGTWDRPPPIGVVSWETTSPLGQLRKQALKLANRFRGREPWGWKDPRNSLTLSLWRLLIPELKVLICVRHPLAVAQSLQARGGMSLVAALELWLTYNQQVLSLTSPADRVVTHYDSYFTGSRVELNRIVGLLGIAVSADRLDRGCAAVKPSLVHHRGHVKNPVDAGPAKEIRECYQTLCAEAGMLFAITPLTQHAGHGAAGDPPTG